MKIIGRLAVFVVLGMAGGWGALGGQTQGSAAAKPGEGCPEVKSLEEKIADQGRRLKDWAKLNRYREANAKVAPAAKGENRVVFLGDSITDGWSREGRGEFFPGKPYINRGIGGQTTPQMLVRFRPDVIALGAKVVVILAGTNDLAHRTGPETLGEIQDNLATMAELARAHGIRVVLASILPVHNYAVKDEGLETDLRPLDKILALNVWIKKYAEENGHTYLDYHSAMLDSAGYLRKEWSDDGLHPNAAGYAVMAPLAEAAIRKALGAGN